MEPTVLEAKACFPVPGTRKRPGEWIPAMWVDRSRGDWSADIEIHLLELLEVNIISNILRLD